MQKHSNLIVWFLKTQVTGSDPVSSGLGQSFETKAWAWLCLHLIIAPIASNAEIPVENLWPAGEDSSSLELRMLTSEVSLCHTECLVTYAKSDNITEE